MVNFKKVLAFTGLGLLAIHIVCSVYLTFLRPSGNNRFTLIKYYQYFIHLGPFFREQNIQYSFHVLVNIADENQQIIRQIDLSEKIISAYSNKPWQFHQLTKEDFVRKSALKLARAEGSENYAIDEKSETFIELRNFVLHEVDTANGSVAQLILTKRRYVLSENKHAVDTLIKINYRLANLEHPE